MESEQSQNFNERLSQWVANQGFWFQIRYSMSGSGSKGTAMFHLLRMGFRLLLFLLVVAVGGWIYLYKMTESEKFSDGLKDSLKEGLFASEAEMVGFSRAQGQLGINRVAFQGGNNTFFTSLEARNIRCKMGLLDGVAGTWETGTVAISMLDMELRAGADDPESAQMLSHALFGKSGRVQTSSFEIADANLRWGYSDRTRGSIEKSVLRVQRQVNGFRLQFKGGTFSQNWLRKIDIVNLVISCTPDGLVFETAEFRQGKGTVDLSGLKVAGGERPKIDGLAKIRKLALEDAVPPALSNFVEGAISGDFRVSGSTNSPEGVGFAGTVDLEGGDTISLRDRIHLLKALSTVDYVRNYHRVDFREGSFQLKTTGGGMEVTNLSLKADDLFTLDGNMRVRLPNAEETKAAMEKGTVSGGSPLFGEEDEGLERNAAKMDDSDFTLRRAAQEVKRAKEGAQPDPTSSLSARLALNLDARNLDAQASERSSRTLRYEGLFKITLLPDSFERAPRLTQQYPVDATSNRIPMMVPIEGSLYEITLKQAEDIYQQGRR